MKFDSSAVVYAARTAGRPEEFDLCEAAGLSMDSGTPSGLPARAEQSDPLGPFAPDCLFPRQRNTASA